MRQINVVILVVFLTLAAEAHGCKRKWRNINRDTTPENDGNKPRSSLSSILFGETGCELTCNILSQFYGSMVRPVTKKMILCDCNETFSVNGEQIDMEKFKTLPFNTLWDYWFEKSPESNNLLNRIQRNGKVRAFLLPLMRNPHQTGSEIKQLLMDEFPQLNQIQSVQTIIHGEKEDAIMSAREIDYNNLDRIFPNLFNNARSKVSGAPYETRLYNLLNRLSKDELEYVRSQIQKTGRDSLIRTVTDYMSNRANDNDERQQRRAGRRTPKRLSKISTDERRAKMDESDFDTLERELIEMKVVNDLLEAVGGVQRVRPNAAITSNGPAGRLAITPSSMASNVPFTIPGFQISPFGNDLGEKIRKNIQDNMELMKKQAEQPDENGAHTTFDFNSISDKVITTNVDGEQTRVEDAGVKKIHKDSDRPETNADKEFELNAVSLKNKAENLDKKVIQTVDTDNIVGSSKIQERIKNGDKEFIVYHDAGEKTGAARGQPLNMANADGLNDLKSSTYYLVLDDEGNIVHATNSDSAKMLENDLSMMFQ